MITSILDWMGKGLGEALDGFLSTDQKPVYDASFGDSPDYLDSNNSGFNITGFDDGILDSTISRMHVLINGNSGSGKSTCIIFNSCIDLVRSRSTLILQDINGEIWERLSGFFKENGYKVLRINFASLESETFNPLWHCKTRTDIQKVMTNIYKNVIKNSHADFWEISSVEIMTICGCALLFYTGRQYQTLQNVLYLLKLLGTGDNNEVDAFFANTDDDIFLSYKNFIATNENTKQSILASATSACSLWNDPDVCSVTGTTSVDFTSLRSVPTVVFLSSPLKDLNLYAPLTSIVLTACFDYLLSHRQQKGERDIYVIVDEFSSLRFLNFGETISNLRKGAGLLIAVQDIQSIVHTYGQATAEIILSNCATKVFLPGGPSLKTCQTISQMLGYCMVEDENGKKVKVELRTIDQVRMSTKAFIFIGNSPPLECKLRPYYKSSRRNKICNLPPEPYPPKIATRPPFLNLSSDETE